MLGKSNNVSFLNTISAMRPDGDVVSSLVLKIIQIVKTKYFVSVENYRHRVDDFDKVIERIYELANKTGVKTEAFSIIIRRYCKMVEKNSG